MSRCWSPRVLLLGLAAVLLLLTPGALEAAERLELRVEGMVCPFCEATVESLLRSQPGVLEADASFLTGTAVVVYDSGTTGPPALVEAINARTLYRARPLAAGESFAEPGRVPWWLYGLGLMVVVGGAAGVVVWQRRRRAIAPRANGASHAALQGTPNDPVRAAAQEKTEP